MKIYSEEWYDLCQKSNVYRHLGKSSKYAESFSEEYYKKLYVYKLKKWLKFNKELNEFQNSKYTDDKEFDKIKPFDKKNQTVRFALCNDTTIKELNNNLSKEILMDIPDIRVLALGVASKENKIKIKKFCDSINKELENMKKEYELYVMKESLDYNKKKLFEEIYFHDSYVKAIEKSNKDLTILFDEGPFSNYTKITFHNCSYIDSKKDITGYHWLYQTIYFKDNIIEMNIIFENRNLDLVTVNVLFESVTYS